MAEINICHDLAPSGSLLYPRSDDSAVEKSPHPETGPTGWVWHRPTGTASTCQGGQGTMPKVTLLPQGSGTDPFCTPVLEEDPEPAS